MNSLEHGLEVSEAQGRKCYTMSKNLACNYLNGLSDICKSR